MVATGKQFTAMIMLLSAFSLLPDSGSAQSKGATVMIGGEADFDACSSTGRVSGLNSAGDNFLAVRLGPASSHKMIDKLHNGKDVYMCDQKGSWIGIVYGNHGDVDCGVSSPVAKRQAYSGICKSGWVHQRYITPIAG